MEKVKGLVYYGGCLEQKKIVKCNICGIKTAKDVAAIMYLHGKEYIFCSHECQDRWEEENPELLW